MSVTVKITKNDFMILERTVKKVGKGGTAELKSIFEATALALQGQLLKDFNKRSRQQVRKWKPISAMTYLLRTPGGRKVRSIEEAQAAANKVQILADTGRLRLSLSGRAGYVKRIKGFSVTVGTKVPYSKIHQQTATSRKTVVKFKPTGKQIKNFEANMSKVKSGSKPKRTPTGRVSRAKKNWNKEFFIIRNGLKKLQKSGKSVEVPKRAFIPETKREIDIYRNLFSKIIREGITRVFGDI